MEPLGFDELRSANVARCEAAFHTVNGWSPTDLACAMAGECGEACNQVKKLRRLETAAHWNDAADQDAAAICRNVADELADLIIYADLLAARLGIALGAAVRTKFNRTSEKVGAVERL
jgi:NTP pyrophosphatase (non-canonical NTP hydrolase)